MSISTAILANSPQLYWKLDDGTGPAASDSSGHSNPGVYSGAFSLGVPGPEIGTTACRLGSGGKVASGATTPVLTRPWSIEIWFALLSQASVNQGLTGNQSTSVGASMLFEQQGSGNGITVVRQNIGFASTVGLILDAYWHHVVWTFDASNNLLIYLDGVLLLTQGSQTMNNCTSSSHFEVGQSSAGIPMYVAHAALYSAILTGPQVATQFSANTTPQAPASVAAVGTADLTAVNAKLDTIIAAVRKTFPAT